MTNMRPGWLWRDLVEEYGVDKHGVLKTVKRVDGLAGSVKVVRERRGYNPPSPGGYGKNRKMKRCPSRDEVPQ